MVWMLWLCQLRGYKVIFFGHIRGLTVAVSDEWSQNMNQSVQAVSVVTR